MLILLLAGIALLISLLAVDLQGWENVLLGRRNELVFQGRNRAYGAYPMRREHHRVVMMAFVISLGALVTALCAPRLVALWGTTTLGPIPKDYVDVVLGDVTPPTPPPDIPKVNIEPPKPSMALAVIAFGELVAKDTLARDTVPSQDRLKDAHLGPVDVKGDTTVGHGPVGPLGLDVDTTVYAGLALQEPPEFPGGDPGLQRYLGREIDCPDDGRGTVYVQFVVDTEGDVVDVEVLRGISASIDRCVLRAIRQMPTWSPGRRNGQAVRCRLMQPVRFVER